MKRSSTRGIVALAVSLAAATLLLDTTAAKAVFNFGSFEDQSPDGFGYFSTTSGVVPFAQAPAGTTYSYSNTGATDGAFSLDLNSADYSQFDLGYDFVANGNVAQFMANDILSFTMTAPVSASNTGYWQIYSLVINAPGFGFQSIGSNPFINQSPPYNGQPLTVSFNYDAVKAAITANPSYLQLIITTNQGAGAPQDFYFDNFQLSPNPPVVFQWNNAGGSGDGITWDTAGQQNWNNGSPTTFTAGSDVLFNDVNSGPYAVTISGTNAAGNVTVSATGNYTFSGSGTVAATGSLTLSGPGSLTISNSNTFAGGVSVAGGTLVIANPTAIGTAGTATLAVHTGGEAKLQAGLTTAVSLASVTLDGAAGNWTGQVDITNDKLIIENSSTHAAAVAALASQVAFATANANAGGVFATGQAAGKSVVVIDNANAGLSTFGGVSVDANSILALAAYSGDANLDGIVNISDLNVVAANWQKSENSFTKGDFNGDGIVNISDLNALAANWQKGAGGGSSLSLLPSIAVPEPASLGLIVLGVGAFLKRRRNNG